MLRFQSPEGKLSPSFSRAFQDAFSQWSVIGAVRHVDPSAAPASREELLDQTHAAARETGCALALAGRVEEFRPRIRPEPDKRGLDLRLRLWLLRADGSQTAVARHEIKAASWKERVDPHYAALWIAEQTVADWLTSAPESPLPESLH